MAEMSLDSVRSPKRLAARLRALHWETVASLLVLCLLWHLASIWVDNRVLLPPPALVFSAWWELATTDLWGDVLASLRHLAVGYSIGASIGFGLAIAAASLKAVEVTIQPIVELLRPISGIAWIPIAIALFGIGETVPIFLIAYVSVFPIFINALAGIRAVDPRLLAAARVLGADRDTIVRLVVVPAAMPMIFSGIRLSLGVSWMTLVAAELIGADSGLGWRAFWYEQFFSMHKTMAVILTIGTLGYLIDAAIRLLQMRAMAWHPAIDGGVGE